MYNIVKESNKWVVYLDDEVIRVFNCKNVAKSFVTWKKAKDQFMIHQNV